MPEQNSEHTNVVKTSFLERFGLYYFEIFKKYNPKKKAFILSDSELAKKVKSITNKGMIYSAIIGIICVYPTVWVDVTLTDEPFIKHYGWVAIVTIISIIIEIYILFLISLKAVYEVSKLINLHAKEESFEKDGVFSVKHILARTALELPDPELKILGVDPFKQISKKNLLVLSLLYKAKILITNKFLYFFLLFAFGKYIFGISILYEALIVECFWNCVVIHRVVLEARLRLFGFAIANQIGNNVIDSNVLDKLSPMAELGCLRAIGNAVVMTQNYHPNMIVLLLRFQEILKINTEEKIDDWNIFLETLQKCTEEERNFLLDLFTVSAAFDGKLSDLELENLESAYGKDYNLYFERLKLLTRYMKEGKLNAAIASSKLDFVAG